MDIWTRVGSDKKFNKFAGELIDQKILVWDNLKFQKVIKVVITILASHLSDYIEIFLMVHSQLMNTESVSPYFIYSFVLYKPDPQYAYL